MNHPEPLLILPGLMCDSRMFASMRTSFDLSIVVDGYYDRLNSFAAMAEYVLEAAPERFTLLGHSMGARVALEVMRQDPRRVAGLILANTGIHPVAPGEKEKRHALRDIGRESGFPALVDAWLPPMVAPEHRTPELMSELRAMVLDAGQSVFEAQIEALLGRGAVDDVLDKLDIPVLVMTGELDVWAPPIQHEQIAARIAGAQLKIIPGVGHFAPAEEPAAFASAIHRWRQPD